MGQDILIDHRIKSYEALFENANELIITTDRDGLITKVNRKVEEVSGYLRQELIGKSILFISAPESKKDFFRFFTELSQGIPTRHELTVTGKHGQKEYILASGSIIKDGDEIIEIQYNAHIISDLKAAQETIVSLKDHLKSIIESSPNMIICIDSSGVVELVNPVTEQILQLNIHDISGARLFKICPFMRKYEQIIRWVNDNRSSRVVTEELFPDGNFYNLIIYPLSSNPKSGVVVTAVNITEKKKMQAELIQAQKMESIGLLSSGFAHDFNNILTGITGNIAMMRLAEDETRKQKYLDNMDKITNRAKDLISQILMLSQGKEGNAQNFSLKKAIEEVIDLTTRSIPKNISIKSVMPEKDCVLNMDYTQFTQVMLNLIINSRDAIGRKQNGNITITAHPVWIDEPAKRHNVLEASGSFIRLEVEDNGCGIESENMSRIFEPFFTTKEKGVGTGLGLSITYSVIKGAGGNIKVSSESGAGTKFTIILPEFHGNVETSSEESPLEEHAKLLKILLVDDEPMIREIGREILESIGHEVKTAINGIECLEMLAGTDAVFDAIILDMIMPGLDGYHTLSEMKSRGIKARVIISTGFHSGDEFKEIMANPLVVGCLNKPFTVRELNRILSGIFR
jgi:PAS domain S-box-containing protein